MKLFFHIGRYSTLMYRVFKKPRKWSVYIRQIIQEIDTIGISSLAGKAGSNISSRTGAMCITGQIDALEVDKSRTNAVVYTRVLILLFSLILTNLFLSN